MGKRAKLLRQMKPHTMLDVYNLLQFDLYDYLNLVNSLLCNRCNRRHPQQFESSILNWEKQWVAETAGNAGLFTRMGKDQNILPAFGSEYFHVHHDFYLKKYIFSQKYNDEIIDRWFADTEHGYFHGLMMGFIAYFLLKYVFHANRFVPHTSKAKDHFVNKKHSREYFEERTDRLSQLIFSCIFHDLARTVQVEGHDALLRSFLPSLIEETYRHTHPSPGDESNLVVAADRLELNRYPDFEQWKNLEIYGYYEQLLNPTQKEYLSLFYKNVRPALLYLFERRNQLFVRHGLEVKFRTAYETPGDAPYPARFFTVKGSDFTDRPLDQSFAIEVDRFPFHYCSKHSGDNIWTYIKGYIALDDLTGHTFGFWASEGNLHAVHFDHITLQCQTNLSQWTFLHRLQVLTDKEDVENKHGNIDLEFLIQSGARLALENLAPLLDNNYFNFEKILRIFAFSARK